MNKVKFKVGDLVRKKAVVSASSHNYGIVMLSVKAGKSITYKCLCNDEVMRWFEEKDLYLVARGQSGYTS